MLGSMVLHCQGQGKVSRYVASKSSKEMALSLQVRNRSQHSIYLSFLSPIRTSSITLDFRSFPPPPFPNHPSQPSNHPFPRPPPTPQNEIATSSKPTTRPSSSLQPTLPAATPNPSLAPSFSLHQHSSPDTYHPSYPPSTQLRTRPRTQLPPCFLSHPSPLVLSSPLYFSDTQRTSIYHTRAFVSPIDPESKPEPPTAISSCHSISAPNRDFNGSNPVSGINCAVFSSPQI